MNSRDYWERRAAQDMYDRMGTAEDTAAEMNAAIRQTSAYLEKEVKAVMRGMQSFGISEAEAKKILNAAEDGTALQRLRKAAQQVGDPEKREALLNAINSAGAYRYRITRIEELNKDINRQCRELYKTENRHITSALRNVAEDSYYHEIFSIQKGTGLGFSFSKFPRRDVDRILRSNWSGGNYSQRIWKDVSGMTARLKNELLVSMLSGRSNEKTARIFQEQFGVNAFCARRIVRTESAYVANAAQAKAYGEAGIERYRFVATLDSRTCECCAALDGKVFELAKKKPGTNYPPMHPFCRSTTIADFGDEELAELERRAKDKDGNTVRVPAGMTYEEWHSKFVEGEPSRIYGGEKPDTDSARRKAMASEMNKPQAISVVSSFTPAKTVQEAQEYAGKFIEQRLGDKTFKGVADFKGISVEHANDINRALTDVFEQYDFPKISGIKSIDPNSAKGKKIFSSADAVMAYSPVEHGVYINKNVLKNPEALAAYNKQAQEAWDTVMKNMDSLTGAQREVAMRYKQAGRSLVGDGSAHDYFVHEMGHHLQWEAFDAKTNNSIGSRMSEYAGKISGYATASKSEYFAESFAAFKKGEFDKLDPEFVSFVRGKALDKSAGSGIIEEKTFKTFSNGDEVNEFFGGKGVLQKKNSAEGKWLKSLSTREEQIVSDYCGDGYYDVNAYLRHTGDWKSVNSGYTEEFVKNLDSAINKFNLTDSITVFRGVDENAISNLDLKHLVGEIYEDKGYMSASPIRSDIVDNKSALFEIQVPSGNGRGAYINSLSGFKNVEYEFLLKRGTKCEVTSVDLSGEKPIIRMRVIDNDR